jgi:DNA-binding NarL/FixJ family response regulator
MITILLVDDHGLVRRGFRRILEDEADLQVVGEASSGVEAIEVAQRLRPNVIVMDYAMEGLDGVQATIELRRLVPASAVLILSMHSDETYIRNAFAAGARGYLLKNAMDVDLPAAIKRIAAGRTVGKPDLRHDVDERLGRLTQREKQILQLIAQGNSNKEIAALLGLSVNTVSVHRANLMDALDIHRTAELVLYAIRHGLVSPR